jgi:predicted glycoside hydrolase/deacetylase ChbG (UPF0249 family)
VTWPRALIVNQAPNLARGQALYAGEAPVSDGLLIVNADDWGGSVEVTDAIARCMQAGTVTSTTALVHFADAARAAALARERTWPVGLHLNLTEPFDAAAPRAARERQARIAERFSDRRFRRLGVDPRLLRPIRDAVAEQLEAFAQLYGGPPIHVDGHNHIHLNPMVLAAIPAGTKVRGAAEGRGPLRGARARWMHRRFRTTDAFVAIDTAHPALGGAGIDDVLRRAATERVELMCHPVRDGELPLLLGDGWRAALAGLRLGSYAEL